MQFEGARFYDLARPSDHFGELDDMTLVSPTLSPVIGKCVQRLSMKILTNGFRYVYERSSLGPSGIIYMPHSKYSTSTLVFGIGKNIGLSSDYPTDHISTSTCHTTCNEQLRRAQVVLPVFWAQRPYFISPHPCVFALSHDDKQRRNVIDVNQPNVLGTSCEE